MILLACVPIALAIALLTGGKLHRLAEVRFHHAYLILLALAIQIIVFSSRWHAWLGESPVKSILYLGSLALLVAAAWTNRRIPGIPLLTLGLLLNSSVIAANGGQMPASLPALQTAGIITTAEEFAAMRTANSAIADPSTPLWFLGDILAIPQSLPLANVFSPGDILIGAGAIWFIFANTRDPKLNTPTAPLI